MQRALKELLAKHAANINIPRDKLITKNELDLVIETSNGDIRSAIMALQFSTLAGQMGRKDKNGKRKGAGSNPRVL